MLRRFLPSFRNFHREAGLVVNVAWRVFILRARVCRNCDNEVGITITAMNKMQKFINTVRHGDCMEFLCAMPDNCVDLVVTDPPFAIDFKSRTANYNRMQSRVLDGYNEIRERDYQSFTSGWLAQATRVLKDSGSMYIFSGWNHLKEILIAIDECGLITVNHIIWKYQFGVTTKRKYVTSHYHCLFVCKDDSKRYFQPFARFGKDERTANGGSAHYKDKEDVWDIQREYWQGDKKTPTKLPAQIIEKILDYSSKKHDLVLDPFLGSGQVAVVSKIKNRRYAGCEIVKEYYDFILERLNSGNYRLSATEPCVAYTATPLFDR